MPPNTFFGKRRIMDAIVNNEKSSLLSRRKERDMAMRFGYMVISLLGYPLSAGARIQMQNLFKLLKGEGPTALDVGCSFGIYSFEMQRRGFEVKGIDINKVNIDVANKIKDILGWGPEFSVSDVEALSDSDEMFSTILISHVIEHIKNPQKMLAALYRKLKPGGAVVVTVNPVDSDGDCDEPYNDFTLSSEYKGELEDAKKILTGAIHYRYGMTEEKLSGLLEEAGLVIEELEKIRHPEFFRDSMVLFPLMYPLHRILSLFSKKVYNINIKARKPK